MRSIFSVCLATIATLVAQQFVGAQSAVATELIGLTNNNMLVAFDSKSPANARAIEVKGVDGKLIGIDFRPANKMLYGVTTSNKIYTIDAKTGMATMVSTLSIPFKGGMNSGVDFNPVADRLRLVGNNGENFRINVETGAVTVDKPLNYMEGDRNAGKQPKVVTGAYTNSVAGSKATQLFNIDSQMGALVLQNPPNDGVLKTIGMLNTKLDKTAGIDILTDETGANMAYAVSGAKLYSVDLMSGAAKATGTVKVKDRSMNLIDVAAMLLPNARAAAPAMEMTKPMK